MTDPLVTALLDPPKRFDAQREIMKAFQIKVPAITAQQKQSIFAALTNTRLAKNHESVRFAVWLTENYGHLSREQIHGYTILDVLHKSAFNKVIFFLTQKGHEQYVLKSIECQDIYHFEDLKGIVENEVRLTRLVQKKSPDRAPEIIDLICDQPYKRYIIVLKRYASSLQKFVKREEISTARAKHFAKQCFQCLDCVHNTVDEQSRKILHLDVKPDHFLIDESDNVVIADFGVSKILERHTIQRMTYDAMGFARAKTLGTERYWAPEIKWQDDLITYPKQTDIYACALTVAALILHREPNASKDGKHFTDIEYEKLKILSPVYYELLLWCTEKELSKRPPDCQIILSLIDGASSPRDQNEASERVGRARNLVTS